MNALHLPLGEIINALFCGGGFAVREFDSCGEANSDVTSDKASGPDAIDFGGKSDLQVSILTDLLKRQASK